jgi:hypothetical protein
MTSRPSKDLTGQVFGRLTVDGFSHIKKYDSGRTQAMWHVTCSCGTKKIVYGNNMLNGSVKGCGCLRKEGLNKKERGEASFNSRYGMYKKSAERRSFEFDLTKDQFRSIVVQDCAYCGGAPSGVHHATHCYGSFVGNGVDRIDSSKGYTIDNCVPCCKTCNHMKLDHSVEHFINHMQKILRHLRKV